MQLENTFTVPVPVDQAWAVLLDIERVAPCMPGATLTSVDGDAFTGTVKVKLGPVSMTFKGSGRFAERDEAGHRVVLSASGADSRGGGTAKATVTAGLVAEGEVTRVNVSTDLDITGKAAQFGRGLIGDVSGRLIGQFADCLAGKLTAVAEPVAAAPEPVTAPGPAAVAAQPGAAIAEPVAATAEPVAATAEPVAATAEPVASTAEPVAATAEPGAAAAGQGPDAAPVAKPAPVPPIQPEAEPIDLLAVSGVGPAVRRAVPYVVTAAASFAVVLGIIWWIRRR
ncbi:SRPBCC family protein [Dactylosporangium sp. CA-092794]|uniref:SRPBCC family protein n=1 Tax=Dactylosporangium sp. CA-092794 TaxID=3239929 RepID=UPI003D922659